MLILVGETTCDSKGGIIIACDVERLIIRQFLLIRWDTPESSLFILISSLNILVVLVQIYLITSSNSNRVYQYSVCHQTALLLIQPRCRFVELSTF